MAVIINPYTIPSFFAGIMSIILGIYALYKNPKDRGTQVFFVMMVGCSLWSLTPILVQAQASAHEALFWAKLSNTGLLLIPVALFHFALLYKRKKPVESFKIAIAIVYIMAIVMIILLLTTNLFFTMSEDALIDGDGAESVERGDGNFTEDLYYQLTEEEQAMFTFLDLNNDQFYTIENSTNEPLIFNNTIIVGTPDNLTGQVPISFAENRNLFYYVDENKDGEYTAGESLYLENGDGNQKLTYNYSSGPLYFLLILFFFGFIIASIIVLILVYLSSKKRSVKKPTLFLIIGLIAIMIFIFSQTFLAMFIPLIILDSFIALIISLFFTIAVLKYNIIDIKLILRKSMFYSSASLLVVGIFVVVEEGMEIVFSELAFSGSILSGVIAAFVVLGLFSIVKKGLRNQIDRLFPNVRYLDKEYQNRFTAYQETIVAMLADGKISDKEKSALDILRDKLEIRVDEHDKLLKSIKTGKRVRPA